jgi:outer membrane protein assembly factor BamB
VDSASGVVKGEPIKLTVTSAGGLLSCGTQTAPVSVYASPVVASDMVIIGGYNDGKVYAFPLIEGRLREQQRWIYPPQGNIGGAIMGGISVSGGKLYFGTSDGSVYALDATDGFKEWSVELGAKIWSAPVVDGDTLYVGTFDKKLYALNIVNGETKWEFITKGVISATPVVSSDIVYIGSFDRHMYAVDTRTGNLVWKFPVDGTANVPHNWFWTRPVLYGSNLYAPNLDGKVYVLNAQTGNLIKAIDMQEPITSSPVLVGDAVIVAATNLAKKTSRVYAISTADNSLRELTSLTQGINSPLFAVDNTVYFHSTSDNFYGLNIQNGALQKFSLTTTTK